MGHVLTANKFGKSVLVSRDFAFLVKSGETWFSHLNRTINFQEQQPIKFQEPTRFNLIYFRGILYKADPGPDPEHQKKRTLDL